MRVVVVKSLAELTQCVGTLSWLLALMPEATPTLPLMN